MSSGIWPAVIAVCGTLAAGLIAVLSQVVQARKARTTQAQVTYRDQLREACTAYASNLTACLWAALEAGKANPPGQPYVPSQDLLELRQAARVSMENLRLLSNSKEVQRTARMALRHSYAVMLVAGGEDDPRAADYPNGPSPYERFESEFRGFLVAARRELGLADPDDVFPEP